jgi:cytochrome b
MSDSVSIPEAAATPPRAVAVRVRVWDLPTRVTHWTFVIAITFLWWTADTGRMEWHRWAGYTMLALLLFRVYWGFFGSSTARFSRFVRGPRAIGAYLKGSWPAAVGHNPLGALSVIGLLGLMLLQVSLGLFAVDVDGIESGPLSLYVSFEGGRAAAEWHEIVFNALLVLIAIHVAAVLFYLAARRQNLSAAMVSGKRNFETDLPPMTPGSWPRLLVGIVLAGAITWAVSKAFQFG